MVAVPRRLGAQIALVMGVGGEDVRHALDDVDAAARQRRHLVGLLVISRTRVTPSWRSISAAGR